MNRENFTKEQFLIKARLNTNIGGFDIMLDAYRAPKAVTRFIDLIIDDFYVDTIFHRVLPNYIIQGGGHDVNDKHHQKEIPEKYEPLENESFNGLMHSPATIAMARNNYPDSAKVQFFINLSDNWSSNAKKDNPGYTVFGLIPRGMNVVTKISEVDTESENPIDPIVIKSVSLSDEFLDSEAYKTFVKLKNEKNKSSESKKAAFQELMGEPELFSQKVSKSFGSDSLDSAEEISKDNEEEQNERVLSQSKKINNAQQTAENMLKKFTRNSGSDSPSKEKQYQEL
jgi:peptidyl-prolyl cis-trans isomerase A (cyclophilin A)